MSEKEITVENYDEETYETLESTTGMVEPEFQQQIEDEEVSETAQEEEVEEAVEPELSKEEKSLAHFQRVAQEKHDLAIKKDAEIELLRQQLNESKPKPVEVKEETLQYPKAADPDDDLDQIRFARELAMYTQKTFETKSKILDEQLAEINAERQETQKQNQWKQHRSSKISEFIEAGATVDEAPKLFDFGYSTVSADPKNLLNYFRHVNGQKTSPQTKQKINMGTLPVGVGETEEKTVDPDKQFYEEMERPQRKWL